MGAVGVREDFPEGYTAGGVKKPADCCVYSRACLARLPIGR